MLKQLQVYPILKSCSVLTFKTNPNMLALIIPRNSYHLTISVVKFLNTKKLLSWRPIIRRHNYHLMVQFLNKRKLKSLIDIQQRISCPNLSMEYWAIWRITLWIMNLMSFSKRFRKKKEYQCKTTKISLLNQISRQYWKKCSGKGIFIVSLWHQEYNWNKR